MTELRILQNDTAGTVKLAGYVVRRLGYGAMRVSGALNADGLRDRAEAVKLYRRVVERGINLIDTANIYGFGESEEILGEALHPYPDDLLITTKAGFRPGKILAGHATLPPLGAPEHIRQECEKSLRRLKIDCIDLYQVHVPDPAFSYGETVGAFAELQAEGKVRHIGVSNVSLLQLEIAQSICEVVSVQNAYGVGNREHEAIVKVCEDQSIAFFAHSSNNRSDAAADERLDAIAVVHGVSRQQVATAWLLQHSPAIIPIPGTSSLAHLDDNIDAAWLKLSTEEIAFLDDAEKS